MPDPRKEHPGDVTLFFVVQPGSLSLRARFLVASLRSKLPKRQKIHAFVPRRDPELDSGTRRFLDAMQVELRMFDAELWDRFEYPIGNKIDAARQGFTTSHALFLDTDILCLSKPLLHRITAHSLTATVVIGTRPYSGNKAELLDRFAQDRLGITLVRQPMRDGRVQPSLPIFNSGVVGFDARTDLADQWFNATVSVFESDLPEKMKRPFADQVSLGLTAAMRADPIRLLHRRWNRSPNLMDHTETPENTIFLHYFRFPKLLMNTSLRERIIELHKHHEADGHNLLGEMSVKDLFVYQNVA